MTNKSDNYKGYTPIDGFEAESLQELHNNIKEYLEELIGMINEPLSECEHCNGYGHVLTSFNKNRR